MKQAIFAILTTSALYAGTAHALPQGIHKWETSGGKLILVHGIYQDEIHYRRNYSFYFQQNSSPADWLQVPIMEKKGIPSIGWDSASRGEVTLEDATVVQRAGKIYFITASKSVGKGTPYDPGDVTVTWHMLFDGGDNDHDGTAQKFKPVSTRVVRTVANGVDEILEKEAKLPYVRKQSAEILERAKVKPAGKVVSILQVEGQTDEKLLVLSEKPSKSANGRVERIDLNATYYARTGEQWRSEWAINDFVDCPGLDSKASFFADATTITDIDNDGKPEVTVAYQLFCGGGIDPSTVKVILRQGDTKFAIRGESLIRLPGQAPIGGAYTPDPSLQQPKNAAFLKHLKSIWSNVHVEKR
jgi:hypothetical protein